MQRTSISGFQAGSTAAAVAGAVLGLAMSPDYDGGLQRSAPRQELHVVGSTTASGRSVGPGLAVVVADTLAPAKRILRRVARGPAPPVPEPAQAVEAAQSPSDVAQPVEAAADDSAGELAVIEPPAPELEQAEPAYESPDPT